MGDRHILNVVEFLQDLTDRGESLALVDGRLQYRARKRRAQQQTIRTIQQHKSELIAWLHERSTEKGDYPLSQGQHGLWMAWHLDPESPIYNVFTIARLRDEVDLATLQRAAQALIDRHPVLRTIYPLVEAASGAVPMQRIHAKREQPVAFTILDGERLRPAQIDRWMEAEADRPFDLMQGPVMRMVVLRTRSTDGLPVRYLHWTTHHIASDFFTQEIIIEELESCYRAVSQDKQPDLPTLELTYRDFVRWEADLLQAEEEKLASYWRRQLGEEPPILNLPTDLSAGGYQGNYHDFAFDSQQAIQLRTFAQAQQITLFTLLLTAYQIVLARYSAQENFFVTSPTSVRNLPGWERTAGYLINPLLLEADLSGNPTVSSLLKRVHQRVADAFAHQMYPYSSVLRLIQAARPSIQLGKIAAGFILDTARKPASAPTLFAEIVAVGQRGTPEELSMSIFDMARHLSGQVTYNAHLFLPESIERMVGHFQIVLQRMMDNPEQPIQHLSLLTDAQRHEILVEWSTTSTSITDDAKDKAIHDLFEEQVARTPDAVAVIFDKISSLDDAQLTYRELNERANQLAHYLQAQGVGTETLVGICVERSIQMVVGLLGILKAGAAYVPLDPSYPQERLAFMLQDADVSLLLTQEHLSERLPSTTAQLICLDRDWSEIGAQPSDNPCRDVRSALTPNPSPNNGRRGSGLAVIYTSGSTGQPKGVEALHSAAVNRFAWMWRTMPFAPHDVCCQKTALSFVDSVWEIFGPLLQGVPLVIIPDAVVKDPLRFVTTLNDHKVTRLVLVPSLLRTMLEGEAQRCPVPRQARQPPVEGLQDRLPHLTQWICSGEALSLELVQQFYTQMPNAQLINLYGSSEVAADATWYDTSGLIFKNDPEPEITSVPIGRPIDNIECYILDAARQPVPLGVPGELYIGGAGLARGYHKRPDLTNERFIPNPFGLERLFKTGDLARWLPSSTPEERPTIEFLGRADHQVKIRGFRIELGEIEATLRQHSAVQEAIVVARDDAYGDKRLVAYVVIANKMSADDNQSTQSPNHPVIQSVLRDHLTQKLPDYMIPAAFVLLDALPLTPNGKVDRQALPAPDESAIVKANEFVSPQTPIEETVANIWGEMLGVSQVGRHDHFFVMGGHSLLATQLMTRIQHILHTELPIRAIFDHPTIAGLSKQIKEKVEEQQLTAKMQSFSDALTEDEVAFGQRATHQTMPPLQAVVRPAVLPLSYAQERLWFFAQLEEASTTYNISFALRLGGALDRTALTAALHSIVQRHEVLRTTFPAVDGVAQQVIAPRLDVEVPFVDLSKIPESEQESALQRQLTEAALVPFDLAVGPLIRATLYRLAEQEHILLIALHHIVGDGWSLGILLRELDVCYRAALESKPLSLPPLPYQYADFAIWQREHLQGQLWEQQLSWWQQQLAAVPKLLELPTDYPRPPVQGLQSGTVTFTFDVALTKALEALSQQMGASLFMTLYAAFAVLLMRYSGQDDMVIGTPIANRHHREVEPLIGFFVNTLPLRADLSGAPSFSELLQRVRQMTLDAYAHQDLPFEQVVNALQIERSLSYSPLFQVMMSVEYTLSHPASEPQPLGELTATRVEIEQVPALFDLNLQMVKIGDRLQGWLDYSATLFKPDTIKRMVSHFQELLQGIVADPQQSIHQLSLLTAAERHQILVEWNATQTDYPSQKCIHQFFEEQVERTPDAVAVIFDNQGGTEHRLHTQQLTYRELNTRANQLAHYLRSQGVGVHKAKGDLGTETLVGIYVERSLEMVIAILGVLKAGGAYLPIDPMYPAERINFILEDAQPLVVVTQKTLVAELATKHIKTKTKIKIKTICLDCEQSQIAQHTTANLNPQTTPDNAAYVIYTSGSTGRPKGVIIEQRNLVNYVCMFINEFGLRKSDRAFQWGSISFDVSVEEIFPTLCVGATLVICANTKEVDTLLDDVIRHRVTVLSPTPLVVQHFNSYADEATDLRLVISGGGVLQPAYIDRLLARHVSVYNTYGPTEATVCCSSYKVEQLVEPLPIGRPVANTQFYVLDEYLQPVPIGVPGELYIGGAGVGRSYLNRPALTAKKFVNCELRTDSNALTPRLYKTGDLVRWRSDGLMEFLARIDHQVKIRGFRIELGEIEAVLSQHPLVQEAVVIIHEGTASDKRLVAYVTWSPKSEVQTPSSAASDADLSTQEYVTQSLRDYLREKLPEYMIPALFMVLDALPLTPNNKIDRKALPAPALQASVTAFARPRTLTEQNLVAVWREVLQVEQVGIYDNFFDLGGHSLLAVRLMAQMRQVCGQQLPLQILFQHPTVAALATYLQQAEESPSWSTLVALQPQGERAPFFCVPGDGGNVFYFYPLVQALGNQQPFYGLESVGLDGKTPPHATVEEAAAYHITELQRRFPQGPYYLGGHSFGGIVAFEMAQQLCKAGETVALLAIMDTNAPSMPLQSFSEVELMIIFEHLFSEEYGYPPSLTHELLEPLPSEERLLRLKLALEKGQALPSESTLTEVKGLFNVFKTNAQTSYHPHAPRVIPLPIELFLAEEQPLEHRQEIINGWSALGQVNVHTVPGTHTTMTYPPQVQILAQKLAACLETAYTNLVPRNEGSQFM